MTHLSDGELRTEHLAILALNLNRLDLLKADEQEQTLADAAALNPHDLVDVMAASKEFAMLMLKLAVGPA